MTPSACTTTITTIDSGNGITILANMLQSELDRKLADLKDIRAAYNGIIAVWTDEKPKTPTNYSYIVNVCYARAMKTWQYQHQLEDAAAKIEVEIAQIRKDIMNVLMNAMRQHHPTGFDTSISD
ncbi:hypothetical protein BGZ96_008794 [Linnemannia gamsii]|uniref:Uncharacterized protein n=1 Tax=Linnemannia gamsii TaxID=64522 RepID=A0ABQ7JYL7_9FUNG|nr:hypothetical protein BGZ96_008794 [Linnemannia gamsii]